jgi:hypothetical protein
LREEKELKDLDDLLDNLPPNPLTSEPLTEAGKD